MISVSFRGKSFSFTVIQVYALTSNAEETEVERFYDVNHLNHLYTISLQKRKPGLDKDQRLLTLHDFTPPIILYAQLNVGI